MCCKGLIFYKICLIKFFLQLCELSFLIPTFQGRKLILRRFTDSHIACDLTLDNLTPKSMLLFLTLGFLIFFKIIPREKMVMSEVRFMKNYLKIFYL